MYLTPYCSSLFLVSYCVVRKVKKLKITYVYAGDEFPEAKAESERRLALVYNRIFDMALKNIPERKLKQNETK